VLIDYRKIADAVDFYKYMGFNYIEVPWIVGEAANGITRPKNKKPFMVHRGLVTNGLEGQLEGQLVGSGEQSMLQMVLHKQLEPGKYVCVTPCFRDEKLDELHSTWFVKAEIIDTKNITQGSLDLMVWMARKFFSGYVGVKSVPEGNGYDILTNCTDIELGSYGINSTEIRGKKFEWVYGTAVAEPRLSQAIQKEEEYVLSL
jgi:hypothetical protein